MADRKTGMRVWLLRRCGRCLDSEPDYDVAMGFVVRAGTCAQARRLAADNAGGEGKSTWTNARRSSCEVLMPDGELALVVEPVVDDNPVSGDQV